MQGTARACLLRAVADDRPRAKVPGQVSYIAGLWPHTLPPLGIQALGRQSTNIILSSVHPFLMGTARSTNCSLPIVVPRPKTPGIKHHSLAPRHGKSYLPREQQLHNRLQSGMRSPRVSGGEGAGLVTKPTQRNKCVFTHAHILITVSQSKNATCKLMTPAAAATTSWSPSHLGLDHQGLGVVDQHQAAWEGRRTAEFGNLVPLCTLVHSTETQCAGNLIFHCTLRGNWRSHSRDLLRSHAPCLSLRWRSMVPAMERHG